MYRVGIIGLGKMGSPIAHNLIQRGFEVFGYRRTHAAEVAALGAIPAVSPAQLAAECDVLLSILPDADALESCLTGSSGILAAVRSGTVHIEMSTIDVARKAELRDLIRSRGGDMLDCPISGSPPMVAPRLATTFVSGERDSVDRVRTVLDAISGPWVYTGAFGTGAQMKYVANLLVAVHTVAAAEAMALARSFGLDLTLVRETLDDSIASSAIWRQRAPLMQERRWTPAPGPIATLHSILDQIESAAIDQRTDLPTFAAAKALFDRAVHEGWGELDIAAVHDQLTGEDPTAGS